MTRSCPAAPLYGIGEALVYVDHHSRQQIGKVRRIEASWSHSGAPLITYTCGHPSYRNGRMYVGETDVLRAAPLKPEEA